MGVIFAIGAIGVALPFIPLMPAMVLIGDSVARTGAVADGSTIPAIASMVGIGVAEFDPPAGLVIIILSIGGIVDALVPTGNGSLTERAASALAVL